MTWEEEKEAEANIFAMELLVPTSFLLRDLAGNFAIDPTGDERVKALAKRYGVTVELMMIRIADVSRAKRSRKCST